jgi:hypothetical protein
LRLNGGKVRFVDHFVSRSGAEQAACTATG